MLKFIFFYGQFRCGVCLPTDRWYPEVVFLTVVGFFTPLPLSRLTCSQSWLPVCTGEKEEKRRIVVFLSLP